MTTFCTTLRGLRKRHACEDRYAHLVAKLGEIGDDDPINLLTILEHNGVQDMLWALMTVKHPDVERISRLMAADFAEQALPIWERRYPNDSSPRQTIETVRRYALGEATQEELAAAWAAAWTAGAAAWTAGAAAWTAGAAAWTAGAAALATRDAAGAAALAARDAAGAAAEDKQARIIRRYLE